MSAQLAVIFSHGTLGFEQWIDWVEVVGGWFDHPFFPLPSSLPPSLSQLILSKQAQTPTQASTHSISRT